MKTEEKEKKSYDTTNFHIFVWLLMNDVPLIKVFWASDKSGDRDQDILFLKTSLKEKN